VATEELRIIDKLGMEMLKELSAFFEIEIWHPKGGMGRIGFCAYRAFLYFKCFSKD